MSQYYQSQQEWNRNLTMNLAFVYMHLHAVPRETENNFQSVRTVPSFDFVRVFARFVGRVAHACRVRPPSIRPHALLFAARPSSEKAADCPTGSTYHANNNISHISIRREREREFSSSVFLSRCTTCARCVGRSDRMGLGRVDSLPAVRRPSSERCVCGCEFHRQAARQVL